MRNHCLVLMLPVLMLMGAGCGSGSWPASPSPAAPTMPASTAPSNLVTYTDSGFSPKALTVKIGTRVTFQNNAADAVRVASNPHPLHTDYPTTGGCIASTFDSCANIAPQQSWSFVFDKVGTWGYHNHLDPGEGGTVTVTP